MLHDPFWVNLTKAFDFDLDILVVVIVVSFLHLDWSPRKVDDVAYRVTVTLLFAANFDARILHLRLS